MSIFTGNLFELAEKELIRENKKYTLNNVIDYAILIRKWLDRYGKKGNILKQIDKKLWKREANLKYRNKK